LLLAGCLLGLLFNLEDQGSTFLQNAGELVAECTTSHPRKYYFLSHCNQAFRAQIFFKIRQFTFSSVALLSSHCFSTPKSDALSSPEINFSPFSHDIPTSSALTMAHRTR
jgi:hypothetical protein